MADVASYRVLLEPDDNGTIFVTCPDLPEVTTWGDDQDDALRRAVDAVEEALAARIAHRNEIPQAAQPPCAPTRGGSTHVIELPPLTVAKLALYRAARATGTTKAELGRRLGWHAPQVDRLFDLRHRSQIDQIDQALHALGKRVIVRVEDAG